MFSTELYSNVSSYYYFADQKVNMNLKQCAKSNEDLWFVWPNIRD